MRTAIVVHASLFFAALAAGQGSVRQTPAQPLGSGGPFSLTIYWTGDPATGAVPVTAAAIPPSLTGLRILQVETVPGSPAPTTGYGIQLLDSFGGDLMSGQLSGLSSTAPQFFGGTAGTPPLIGGLRLSITGQSVAAAQGSVTLYIGSASLVSTTVGSAGPSGPQGPQGSPGLPSAGIGALVASYQFTPQAPGGVLGSGNNTIVLSPVPAGVNGSDYGHRLYVSGGSGTAEACLISGGSASAGLAGGELIINCANSHLGAWTIQSATAGWQECAQAQGVGGACYFSPGAYTLYGGFTAPYSRQAYFAADPNTVTIMPASGANIQILAVVGSRRDVSFLNLGWDGNFTNQTYQDLQENGAIDLSNSIRARVAGNRFHAFGFQPFASRDQNLTHYAAVIWCAPCEKPRIENNSFYSIWANEGNIQNATDAVISGNISGTADLALSNAATVWWDTMSGGFGWYAVNLTDGVFERNLMYGGIRDAIYTIAGPGIGVFDLHYGKISQNYIYGLSNAPGTLSVTKGSGTITGTNTVFYCASNIDVNRHLVIQGDSTIYKITTCNSATSIVVTPRVGHSSGSGLTYQFQIGPDQLVMENSDYSTVDGNQSIWSGDHAINIGTNSEVDSNFSMLNKISNNVSILAQTCGIWAGGANYLNTFSGNYMYNVALNAVAGNRGGFCFGPADAAGSVKTATSNYFAENTVIVDPNAPSTEQGQLYFMEVDSSHFSGYVGNVLGPNNFPYQNSGLGIYMFDPQTNAAMSNVFPATYWEGQAAHSSRH